MPADPAPGSLAQKDASTLGNMICRDFLRGVCYRGKNCKFLHSEQHAPPVTNQLPVCRDYQNGTCNRRTCKYAHIYSASGFYDPITMKAIPQSDTKHLKEQTYLQASYYADNGVLPPVTTGFEEVFKTRANPTDPLCKDFQNGYCQRGETCRYRHVSFITDETEYPMDMINPNSMDHLYQSYNTYDQNYLPPRNQTQNINQIHDPQHGYYSQRNQGYEKQQYYPPRSKIHDTYYDSSIATKRGPITDSKSEFVEKNAFNSISKNHTDIENLIKENAALHEEIAKQKHEIESLKAELASLRYKQPSLLKTNELSPIPQENHYTQKLKCNY